MSIPNEVQKNINEVSRIRHPYDVGKRLAHIQGAEFAYSVYAEEQIKEMDKTTKQIIKENNANGVKNILWDDVKKKWIVSWLGNGSKPNEYDSFYAVVKMLKPTPGH